MKVNVGLVGIYLVLVHIMNVSFCLHVTCNMVLGYNSRCPLRDPDKLEKLVISSYQVKQYFSSFGGCSGAATSLGQNHFMM